MKKLKILIIPLIIITTSAIFGFGGYFYGKFTTLKKAEIEKEAAVKGIIYDSQEKMSQEALAKAQEVLDKDKNGENTDAAKTISEFFSKLNDKKYDESWSLLSSDYKKELSSINGLKKLFLNVKEIKIIDTEFRTSGKNLYLYSVTIEKITAKESSNKETHFIRVINETLSDKWLIDSIELKENDSKNQNLSKKE